MRWWLVVALLPSLGLWEGAEEQGGQEGAGHEERTAQAGGDHR